MIWDSVILMTAIDIIIMAAALLAILVYMRYRALIAQLYLTIGVLSVLLALVVTAGFYLLNLLIIHNVIVSAESSDSVLTDLHLNWRWIVTLISIGSITLGLAYMSYRLLPQTASTLDALHGAKHTLRAKNEELEALVNQRVEQLIAVNEKLEQEIKEHAEAEARLTYHAGLLENISDAVISCDKDFKIISWNDAAQQIYGWAADEVIGRDATQLFNTIYPDDLPVNDTDDVYRVTGYWKGEAIHTRKDGQQIDVFISSSPLLNEAGEMVGAVAVNRDISDFKRTRAALAQERNTLRTLLDNLLDFVYAKDREGRFILANASLAQFMGVDSPQELIGKTDLELHRWEEAAGFRADELRVMESGEPIINKYETNTMPESGTQFTVLTTKLPYRNDKGEVIGIIGISRDVTALSEAERLRAEKEKLEVALDKERELSQIKVDFMATAAHEFRTPLTIIQTSSAMLNNYWGRLDEASRRNKLTGIEAQVSHLSKLLDELGMSIQAERGQIRYSPGWVDVLELVKRLSEEVQPMLNEKHHFEMIHPPEMGTLYLDGELIYSGLLILVSNAIKYSPDGGPVTLTLSATNEHLQVIVQDHGIGIPDDDQNRLLDPFFRGSNVGTIRGTGSGLSIVKEIVDLHSGDIQIESQVNQGATFTVTLPISQNGGLT